MVMATISDKTGWDYWQILEQPTWYLELMMRKWEIDADIQEKENRRREAEAKNNARARKR